MGIQANGKSLVIVGNWQSVPSVQVKAENGGKWWHLRVQKMLGKCRNTGREKSSKILEVWQRENTGKYWQYGKGENGRKW